jgi:hypothetical protein
MSEPKRYIFRIRECGCVKPEHLEGKYAPSALIIEETEEKCGWVGYEDYARLKAEVERLTKAEKGWFNLSQLHLRNNLSLETYSEELEKAGDAMAEEFSFIGSPDGGFNSIDQWNAAKEGKGQP